MKKIIGIVLCFCLLFSVASFAIEPRSGCTPRLSFNGTTAKVEVAIQSVSQDIEGTVQLWCGNSMLESWEGSGRDVIVIKGSVEVEHGKTYTLRVNGTFDGKSFPEATITKKCP